MLRVLCYAGSPSILCSSGVMVAHLMPTLCSCIPTAAAAAATETHREDTQKKQAKRTAHVQHDVELNQGKRQHGRDTRIRLK